MPSRVTPPGYFPRWMAALFPHLKGVESNPLYIRLSGQGFCKRPGRFWRRTPPELRFPRGVWLGRIGCLPFILLAFAPPVGVALILLALFGWGVAGVDVIRNFILNGAAEPWGEGIALSLLTPAEIDAALFAVALQREFRRLAWMAPSLFAVGAYVWGHAYWGPRNSAEAIGTLASASVLACFVFAELFAVGALELSVHLETIPHSGIGGLERIYRSFTTWTIAFMAMIPAFAFAHFGLGAERAAVTFALLCAGALAVLLIQAFTISLARDGLEKFAGNAAREMFRRIHKRHEAG